MIYRTTRTKYWPRDLKLQSISTINQQKHLYNFQLKHFKTVKTSPSLRSIRRTPSQLHSLQQIPTQHDMLPQHLVYKKETKS